MTTLQFLRLNKRIGQPALAKLSGVPQATISFIETGRLRPYPHELEKLARALDVAPEVLMREVMPDLSTKTKPTNEAVQS